MRVLQINSVCGIGSTGRIATDIEKVLESEGHESYIAFGRNEAKDSDTAIKIGGTVDNYLHVAQTRLLDQHGFGSRGATKHFLQKIDKLNPDVIHLHNIHGYYINVKMLFDYLKEVKKPVVWTLHDCWPFTGHCSYFEYIGCEKWMTECSQCPLKQSYPSSFLYDNSKENHHSKKRVFTGVDNLTIVTPSRWLARLVRKSFLQNYPLKIIHNGIDLHVFQPTKSHFREIHDLKDRFIILGVANIWDERKGFDYFLKLADQLKEDEVIVLVGLTKKQLNYLPSNIIGIEKTTSTRELAQIYSVADVFVNPTLEDNFPTTNLEALACGTPVITFRTGGSIESIDQYSGVIVEKGNEKELYEAIKQLKIANKSQIDCIERAKLFDKNFKFLEYIRLYKELSNKQMVNYL